MASPDSHFIEVLGAKWGGSVSQQWGEDVVRQESFALNLVVSRGERERDQEHARWHSASCLALRAKVALGSWFQA